MNITWNKFKRAIDIIDENKFGIFISAILLFAILQLARAGEVIGCAAGLTC
jgi:hypothetical protein